MLLLKIYKTTILSSEKEFTAYTQRVKDGDGSKPLLKLPLLRLLVIILAVEFCCC